MSESQINSNLNASFTLAQPDARLGAHFLNGLFVSAAIVATGGIYFVLQGWIDSGPKTRIIIPLIPIFILINYAIDAWSEGTTLGHKALGLYIVDEKTGEIFSLSRMVIREVVIKAIVCGLLSVFTFYIFFIVDSLMATRDDRKTLHDRMVGSLVIKR
jgi:uncharacterized RDD family membrane protein YckC